MPLAHIIFGRSLRFALSLLKATLLQFAVKTVTFNLSKIQGGLKMSSEDSGWAVFGKIVLVAGVLAGAIWGVSSGVSSVHQRGYNRGVYAAKGEITTITPRAE
ncbi:MAG: hypothetical protein ABIA47_01930 [bacterium]